MTTQQPAAPADPPQPYRPTTRLTIPLQTGGGFAMALFMWGCFWVPALVLAIMGGLLLVLGHWVLGPVCTLAGTFFVAAFWSFPRDVWVARPCDIEFDADGFRVVGGHHGGVRLAWGELDAAACGVRDAGAVTSQVLFAATRNGQKLTVAEGDEYRSFAAVLDAWRASAGLPPLDGREPEAGKPRNATRGSQPPAKPHDVARRKAIEKSFVRCGNCGAVARPSALETTRCLSCGEAVAMPAGMRQRVRDALAHAALTARSQKLLEQVLARPRAPLTLALMGVLGAAMVGAWLLAILALARAILDHTLDITLVTYALAAPLLATLTLSTLASVVAVQRVAVRAVAVDFAAIAPPEWGQPCSCRVCGAPLPPVERDVVQCAYCSSFSVVSAARPRAPSYVQEEQTRLEETLAAQSAEHITRWILVAVVGVPALWGAMGALRGLWARLS